MYLWLHRRAARAVIIAAMFFAMAAFGALALRADAQGGPALSNDAQPVAAPHPLPLPALSSIPVPYDPMEAVTQGAQPVENAEERAEAISLIDKARQLSNVRAHGYDLKTSFTSYGSSTSDGSWTLEDMSPGPKAYRWTAQGPGFSAVFLQAQGMLSSDRGGGSMPLRLAQVRDAMWGVYFPFIGPYTPLRTANGDLNGSALRCVLVSQGVAASTQPDYPSGRSFAESEYCVNTRTGLLEEYSPYAGLYVRYDYANGLHFHEQVLPSAFQITEHGQTVIEAKTDGVGEPPAANNNLFEPAGLKTLGVGQVIQSPLKIRGFQTSPLPDAGGQVVVVLAMVASDGRLTDTEIVASTNSNFDQAAIVHANRAQGPQREAATQAGATPLSREAIFIVEFAARTAPTAPPNVVQ